jgi:hypothetical protein
MSEKPPKRLPISLATTSSTLPTRCNRLPMGKRMQSAGDIPRSTLGSVAVSRHEFDDEGSDDGPHEGSIAGPAGRPAAEVGP